MSLFSHWMEASVISASISTRNTQKLVSMYTLVHMLTSHAHSFSVYFIRFSFVFMQVFHLEFLVFGCSFSALPVRYCLRFTFFHRFSTPRSLDCVSFYFFFTIWLFSRLALSIWLHWRAHTTTHIASSLRTVVIILFFCLFSSSSFLLLLLLLGVYFLPFSFSLSRSRYLLLLFVCLAFFSLFSFVFGSFLLCYSTYAVWLCAVFAFSLLQFNFSCSLTSCARRFTSFIVTKTNSAICENGEKWTKLIEEEKRRKTV